MTTGIILPEFDPFLINFGGFGIRWYALAYIVGLLAGYWILRREARRDTAPIDLVGIDSLLNHVLLGVILGGRIGFVLFYQPQKNRSILLVYPYYSVKAENEAWESTLLNQKYLSTD